MEFIYANTGQLMDEFVLGTLQSLNNPADEMKHSPSMSHDKPFIFLIAPGKSDTNTWQCLLIPVLNFIGVVHTPGVEPL